MKISQHGKHGYRWIRSTVFVNRYPDKRIFDLIYFNCDSDFHLEVRAAKEVNIILILFRSQTHLAPTYLTVHKSKRRIFILPTRNTWSECKRQRYWEFPNISSFNKPSHITHRSVVCANYGAATLRLYKERGSRTARYSTLHVQGRRETWFSRGSNTEAHLNFAAKMWVCRNFCDVQGGIWVFSNDEWEVLFFFKIFNRCLIFFKYWYQMNIQLLRIPFFSGASI